MTNNPFTAPLSRPSIWIYNAFHTAIVAIAHETYYLYFFFVFVFPRHNFAFRGFPRVGSTIATSSKVMTMWLTTVILLTESIFYLNFNTYFLFFSRYFEIICSILKCRPLRSNRTFAHVLFGLVFGTALDTYFFFFKTWRTINYTIFIELLCLSRNTSVMFSNEWLSWQRGKSTK